MALVVIFCLFRMLSLAMVEERSGWRAIRPSRQQTCPSSIPASIARAPLRLRDLEGRLVQRVARDLVAWGQRTNPKLNAWGKVGDKRWNWKDSWWCTYVSCAKSIWQFFFHFSVTFCVYTIIILLYSVLQNWALHCNLYWKILPNLVCLDGYWVIIIAQRLSQKNIILILLL